MDVVREPSLDDREAQEEVGRETGRQVWSRPTVSDAPGVVRNPAGLPVTIVMMDGDACVPPFVPGPDGCILPPS